MPNTFFLIENKILTSTTTSVTFSSIPATYTDLKLVASVRTAWPTDTNDQFRIRFNGDSGTNYDYLNLGGEGSGTPYSDKVVGATFVANPQVNTAASTADTFSSVELYIPNYILSNNKSVSLEAVSEANTTLAYATLLAGLWKNTAAITSITLLTFRANGLGDKSTFTLYGIKKD
jgi:hypothetical protein